MYMYMHSSPIGVYKPLVIHIYNMPQYRHKNYAIFNMQVLYQSYYNYYTLGKKGNFERSCCYLLSGEKEEDVSLDLLTDVDLNNSSDGGFEIVPLWLGGVEDLHGVSTTRNTLVCVGVCYNYSIVDIHIHVHVHTCMFVYTNTILFLIMQCKAYELLPYNVNINFRAQSISCG